MSHSLKYLQRLRETLENTGDMALKRRAFEIVTNLEVAKGDTILDVGCGDGYYCHVILGLGIPVSLTGTDIDTAALKSAKRNLAGKKVKLITSDLMAKLPFKTASFDKIVMSEVAEHLPNDVKGLKEVYRVLKPGGVLCLTVPNANYPLLWDPVNWILEHTTGKHVKSGFWAGIWNQHIRLYKPEQISKSLTKAGFKVEKIKSLTWWCIPFNHNLVNLVARNLYSGRFSTNITKAVSKYEKATSGKPLLINLGFKMLNTVDYLNTIYQPKNSGVAVFVKAIKAKR